MPVDRDEGLVPAIRGPARRFPAALAWKAELLDRDPWRRREGEHRCRYGAEGDFVYGEFDHRGGARRRVDRATQRHAVAGVEGQLGAGEQAAWLLRGYAHAVGGLTGDVGRCGAGDLRVLAQARDRLFDLGERWRFARLRGRRGVVLLACGWRVAVERVRGRVVELQRVPVAEDLGVALLGLQLHAHIAVLGDPQTAGGAGEERAGGPCAAVPFAACEPNAFEQVIA